MAAVSPTLLAVLTIGVLALVLGIIIGMYTMPVTMSPELDSKLSMVRRMTREYYPAHDDHDPVFRAIIDQTSATNIEKTLNFLSVEPHQVGSERDFRLAQFVEETFLESGLDRAYRVPYKAMLSYANPTRPNKVYLLNKTTKEPLIVSSHQETPMHASEMNPNLVAAYHSFSPKGDITGDPVYCNFGRTSDFQLLIDRAGIDLKDKICILRYGGIYRGNKVMNAARFGCAAVVMFSDPLQVAPNGQQPEAVYPNSMWMNGKAIQRGDVRMSKGDAVTPGFAARADGFRLKQEDVEMPPIPSQPIGYDDAKAILQ